MSLCLARSLCAVLAAWAAFSLFAGCQTSASSVADALPQACSDPYLRHLVGGWDIQRSIRAKVVGNHLDVEPVLGGAFVRLHMQSTTPTDPYEAIVLVGYDAERGEYVAHWCDSFGPGMSAVGRGKREGERLELRFEYPNGPFFNTWVRVPETDEWTFTGESGSADGSRRLFARDVAKRLSTP